MAERANSFSGLVLCLALLPCLNACVVLVPAGPDPVRGTDSRGWFGQGRLQRVLDVATGTSMTQGNAARVLVDGRDSWPRRYANLETARFVLVKTFIFNDDEEGRRMASALAERARAGVPVVLQYDVKGSISGLHDIREMLTHWVPALRTGEKRLIRQLREAGVTVVASNPPDQPVLLREWWRIARLFLGQPVAALRRMEESLTVMDHCDHEKYFVTGHTGGEVRAILGGLNIASEYAWGGRAGRRDRFTGRAGWRDTDIEVRGPAAYGILRDFLNDAEYHTGKPLPESIMSVIHSVACSPERPAGTSATRFVASHPGARADRSTEEVYRVLLRAVPAGEPVFIATPYFAPSRRIRDAIIAHGRTGGTVTLLTNSLSSTDMSLLADAARYSALEVLRGTDNFAYYEWRSRPEVGASSMHQKVATFGHHGPVIIGSFNLDAQSVLHNTECLLLLDDARVREQTDLMVARDLSPENARRITPEELRATSHLSRIRSFLITELAWYWL